MNARLFVVALLLAGAPSPAADRPSAAWPQFRGPAANNVAQDTLPEAWGEQSGLAWSVELPGAGWSSPIVAGGRVFLTTATPADPGGGGGGAYRFAVHSFDQETGEKAWTRVAVEQPPRNPIHRDNSYATETAVTDGRRVVAYFGMTGCFCYDLDGELLWRKDLGAFRTANDWGASSSPAIGDGLVYLQIDNEQESHVVALDLETGDQRWRADRPDEATNWSTPLLWRNSQRVELVTGGKTVRSYEAATGRLLWSMPIGGRSSATPTAIGDTLYIGSENRVRRGGTPGGLFAVRAGAEGELDVLTPAATPPAATPPAAATPSAVAWANVRGAIGISSPLVYAGYVYAPARARGVVAVHDAATGELVNKGRLRGAAKLWASPWAAGDRVYFLDERGATFVLKPGADLEVERTNLLPGRFWSSPAIAGRTLFVRSENRLFAIR